MKIEELVPTLELCKLIPQGEFADSALVFACQPNDDDDDEEEVNIFTRDMINHLEKRWGGTPYTLYVAPTLQEIMSTMPHCRVYKKTNGRFIAVHEKIRVTHMDGATAALKLWFKNKGIEK